MKKDKTPRQHTVRENLDVLRLVLTFVYAAGTGVFGWLIQRVEGQTKRGFVMLFFLICLILCIRSIKKLMTERLQDAIDEWFENAMRWLFRPLGHRHR